MGTFVQGRGVQYRTIILVDNSAVAGRGPVAGSLGILVAVGLVDVFAADRDIAAALARACVDGARVVNVGWTLLLVCLELAACGPSKQQDQLKSACSLFKQVGLMISYGTSLWHALTHVLQ